MVVSSFTNVILVRVACGSNIHAHINTCTTVLLLLCSFKSWSLACHSVCIRGGNAVPTNTSRILLTHRFTSFYIVVFLQITVTFLSYI